MMIQRRKAGTLTGFFLVVLTTALATGCSDAQRKNAEDQGSGWRIVDGDHEAAGQAAAPRDGSIDLLRRGRDRTPIPPDFGLYTGRAQWENELFALGVRGVETQFAFPMGKMPEEYELLIQGSAPTGSLTIYAPAIDYDTFIPLRLRAGRLDSAPLMFKPNEPLDIAIRVWKHHVQATVNGKVAIAHQGDLEEKAMVVEPRRQGRLPITIHVRGGTVRLSRLSIRDLQGEKPTFTVRTTAGPQKSGTEWPVGREYWVSRPAQSSPVEMAWGECDLASEAIEQGLRLHATRIRGNRAYLVHRGILKGDFRWTVRLSDARTIGVSNDSLGPVRVGLLASNGPMRFASVQVELKKAGSEKQVDMQRTDGKISVRVDGKTQHLSRPWEFDSDVYFAMEVRTGSHVNVSQLYVRSDGPLETPLAAETKPPTTAIAAKPRSETPSPKQPVVPTKPVVPKPEPPVVAKTKPPTNAVAAKPTSETPSPKKPAVPTKPVAPKPEPPVVAKKKPQADIVGDPVQTIDLPGRVFASALGADGRILFLLTHETLEAEADDSSLRQGRIRLTKSAPGRWRLVRFDMTARRIIDELDPREHVRGSAYASDPTLELPSHIRAVEYPPCLAAGKSHVAVAWPLERTVVTWEIATGKQAAVRKFFCEGPLDELALGYGSEGPLLVTWRRGFSRQIKLDGRFYDPASMKNVSRDIFLRARSPGGQRPEKTDEALAAELPTGPAWIHVEEQKESDVMLGGPYTASRDSQLFLPKLANEVLRIRNGQLAIEELELARFYRGMHTVAGNSVLNPFSATMGLTDGRSVTHRYYGQRGTGGSCTLPTTSESLLVRVASRDNANQDIEIGMLSLEAPGHNLPLAVFRDLSLPEEKPPRYFPRNSSDLPLSRRIYCNPTAGTLVTIPAVKERPSNSSLPVGHPAQLIVKPFALDPLLEQSPPGPPIVTSSPPCVVEAGKSINYAIKAHVHGGAKSFQLVVGPPAMEVTGEGILSWSAPRPEKDTYVPVSVAIGSTPSAADYYHNFVLRVRSIAEGGETTTPARQARELAVEASKSMHATPPQSSLALPCPYESVVWANGGRFIGFWCPSLNAILVVDVQKHALVRSIDTGPIPPKARILLTASDKYLLMIDRESQGYQRWNLETWQRDGEGKLEFPGEIIYGAMGCNSDGPLLVAGRKTGEHATGLLGALVDINTMKTVWDFPAGTDGNWKLPGVLNGVHASGDGRLFLVPNASGDRMLVRVSTLGSGQDQSWKVITENANQITEVSATANLLYTDEGVIDSRKQRIGPDFDRLTSRTRRRRVPALTGPFYLDVELDNPSLVSRKITTRINFVNSTRLLQEFPFQPRETVELLNSATFKNFERIKLLADVDRLAYLPSTNRELMLFEVEPYKLLADRKIYSVVVAEAPPALVAAGSRFTYTPKFHGWTEGLKLSLTQGPPGMKIEDNATLLWPVPPNAAGTKASVVLAYTHDNNAPEYLSFQLEVTPAAASAASPSTLAKTTPEAERETDDDATANPVPENPVPEIEWYDELRGAPKMRMPATTIRIPTAIEKLCLGGSGRFIIAHLPDINRLAVIDLVECRIHGYVPLQESSVLFAAGRRKLFVVQRGKQQISRWDLATLEMEAFGAIEQQRHILMLAMGHCSDEPLYVSDKADRRYCSIRCIDVETLKSAPLPPTPSDVLGPPSPNFGAPRAVVYGSSHARNTAIVASANGRLILNSERILRLTDLDIAKRGSTMRLSRALLGADGHTVFARTGTLRFDWQMVPQQDDGEPHELAWFATSATDRYTVRFEPDDGSKNDRNPTMVVGSIDVAQPLCRVTNILEEAQMDFPTPAPPLQPEQRIIYLPDARRIALIRPNRTEIYVKRFDWLSDGDSVADDYLFVASIPPKYRCQTGEIFEYQPEVMAANGPVTIDVALGPDGLIATPNGKITWEIPDNQPSRVEPIILSIHDANGKSLRHAFDIEVYQPPGAPLADVAPESNGESVALLPEAVASYQMKIKTDENVDGQIKRIPALDSIGQAALGGDGRFLILVMPAIRAIDVLDLERIVGGDSVKDATRRLRTDTEIVSLRAGPEDIYLQDNTRFMRYDLKSLTLQAERRISETWKEAVVPRRGQGPVCVIEGREPPTQPAEAQRDLVVRLYDAKSLKLLEVAQDEKLSSFPGWARYLPARHLRVVRPTGIGRHWLPASEHVFAVPVPSRIAIGNQSQSEFFPRALLCFDTGGKPPIFVWPHRSWSGTLFASLAPGVSNTQRYMNADIAYITGWSGQMRMHMPWDRDHPAASADSNLKKLGISVTDTDRNTRAFLGSCTVEVRTVIDNQLITQLKNVPYPLYHNTGNVRTLPFGSRVHFLPELGLIVVIPYNNRQIILQSVDLPAAIERHGGDLFVMSVPPDVALRGSEYSYTMEIYSRRGGVMMKLANAPPGAELTDEGTLRWQVPEQGPSEHHEVVIQLTDHSGAARTHRFDLLVLGVEEKPKPRRGFDLRRLLDTFSGKDKDSP